MQNNTLNKNAELPQKEDNVSIIQNNKLYNHFNF